MKPALLILTPVCLLQIYWTRLDFTLLLDNLVADDTFLYLQIVRNIADRGMVSFDGIHSTTGFQPLWAVLLVPLALAIEDRIEFVRWVLVLSVLLNLAAGLMLARLAAALGGPSSGLITSCLWAGYMLAARPAMIGMESPLLALTSRLSCRAFFEAGPPRRRSRGYSSRAPTPCCSRHWPPRFMTGRHSCGRLPGRSSWLFPTWPSTSLRPARSCRSAGRSRCGGPPRMLSLFKTSRPG